MARSPLNPAYAAAVVLIGIAVVIGVAVLLKRRAGNLEAKQTQPPQGIIGPATQTPTPQNQAVAVQPTPAPVPSEQLPRHAPSPSLTVKNREPADQTRWTLATSLKRGEMYVWEVEATIDGKKVVSPGQSAAQMKFKILSVSSAQELDQLKKARSHLAVGVFYAREGMVAEAEHEFQILARDNPQSQVIKKLLKQIQSWHQH